MRSLPKAFLAVAVSMVSVASLGCGGSQKNVVTGPGGVPITLDVVLDRSVGQLPNPEQVDSVAKWMEPDLHKILTKWGYQVVPQGNAQAYQPAPNRYLFIIKVTHYEAGSKAARLFLGSNVAPPSLAVHYTVAGPTGPMNEGDIMVDGRNWHGSEGGVNAGGGFNVNYGISRAWEYCAREASVQATQRVTAFLQSMPPPPPAAGAPAPAAGQPPS
jgi:hypothetical protein